MATRVYNGSEVKADLYARIPGDGEMDILLGDSAIGDIPFSIWQYDANSSATDDFANGVIKPTLQGGNGRWLRRGYYNVQGNWNEASNSEQDFIQNKPSIPSTIRTTSSESISLVGTGATGTQISSTKDSTVRFTVSTSTTSTIGGPATSTVTLKKCATNSATEGDWISVAVLESDQTITLAVALQSVQVVKGQLCADLPAGWFVKLVNLGTGTHSEAFVSGEKTIYG